MRISDWSSDVCSSDLYVPYPMLFGAFLVFRDYADWWSILGLTALYTLGTWYLDRQRQRLLDLAGDFGDPAPWARRFMIGSGITGLTRSEEHTSELQSLMRISYAVFCLKKKVIHN